MGILPKDNFLSKVYILNLRIYTQINKHKDTLDNNINNQEQPKIEEFFANTNNVQEQPKQDFPDLLDLMSLQNNNVQNPAPNNTYENPYPEFK